MMVKKIDAISHGHAKYVNEVNEDHVPRVQVPGKHDVDKVYIYRLPQGTVKLKTKKNIRIMSVLTAFSI